MTPTILATPENTPPGATSLSIVIHSPKTPTVVQMQRGDEIWQGDLPTVDKLAREPYMRWTLTADRVSIEFSLLNGLRETVELKRIR